MRSLLAVGAVALAVRAGYVLAQTAFGIFDVSFNADDSIVYLRIAASIAAGHGMAVNGQPTAYVGPGYPLFLVPLVAIGAGVTVIGVVQAFLGAVTAVLAGLITNELGRSAQLPSTWRRRASLGAALVTALYPHLIFWTGYVTSETLFVLLVALALLLSARAMRSTSPPIAVAAGLASAGAALTRPPFTAVAVAIVVLLTIDAVRRQRIATVLAFVLACALPLAAWTLRNELELGSPIVTTTESGYVFYQGNAAGATGGTTGYVDERDFSRVPEFDALPEVARDRAYLDRALADMMSDPMAVLRRWPAKIWNMWRLTYEGASVRNGVITIASYVPVLVLGIAGAIRLTRYHLPAAWLPAATLVVWFLAHMVVSGMIRFRLPVELVLIVSVPFAFVPVRRERP